MELSVDQQKVLDSLIAWYKDPNRKPYITLGGYAGTGKTTLMSFLRKELEKINKDIAIAFCSYTGKATRVLKSKLQETHTLNKTKDTVSTIHSLIYSPIENAKQEIIGWQRKGNIDANLIIVDEASMVDSEIWRDLTAFRVPIIAVGDHGQLPPISGKFNLMDNPELKLEKIHRQAEENPIIKLSIDARENGAIKAGVYGPNVMKVERSDPESREIFAELLQSYKNDTLILCGYNTTRVKMNKYIRNIKLGDYGGDVMDPEIPRRGDRVICLRNNHEKDIYNGMLGTILSIMPENDEWYYAEIEMDDEDNIYKGLISKNQFNSTEPKNFTEKRSRFLAGDLFDFGYALTVHKAQGSQAKRVVVFEERFKQIDDETWKKWLYTAVTRAEEELYILGQN